MIKKTILLSIILLNLTVCVQALNPIDKFIVNRGILSGACNGESPNCQNSYRTAIELNDDKMPISPEIRF